jgi:hypothetical protein
MAQALQTLWFDHSLLCSFSHLDHSMAQAFQKSLAGPPGKAAR